MSSEDYSKQYLSADDQLTAQGRMEADFLKELCDIAREKYLISTKQLLPEVKTLQLKWLNVRNDVENELKPGMVPVNPAGFLDLVRSFFPKVYAAYREQNP
jgi:hypothetical protein